MCWLILYSSGDNIDVENDDDNKSGGSIEGQDIKTCKVEEAILLSLSLSYSDNDKIFVCDSKPSSCPAYTFY